jgi:PDZ domain-containing protein
VILSANGTPVADAGALREIVNEGGGEPVELTIQRDGDEETVSITPKRPRSTARRCGSSA